LISGQGVFLEDTELLTQPGKRLAARAGGYDQIRTQRRDGGDDQADGREQEGNHTGQEFEDRSHCRNDSNESTKRTAQTADDCAECCQGNPAGEHSRSDLHDRDDDFAIGRSPRADLRSHAGDRLGQLFQHWSQRRPDAKDAHLDDLPERVEGVGEVLRRLGIFAAHGQTEPPGLFLKRLDPRSALGEHRQKHRARPAEQGLGQRRLARGVFDATDRLGQELELLFRRKTFEVLVLQAQVGKRIGLRR